MNKPEPCGHCDNCGWICENHITRPAVGKNNCHCGGAFEPCKMCNADNPPRMIVGAQTRAQPEAVTNAGDVVTSGRHMYCNQILPSMSNALSSRDLARRITNMIFDGQDVESVVSARAEIIAENTRRIVAEHVAATHQLYASAEADLAKARSVIAELQGALAAVVLQYDTVTFLCDGPHNGKLIPKSTKWLSTAASMKLIARYALQSARTWLAANPKMGV